MEGREVQAIFKDLVGWGLVDATMEDVYYVCIQKLDACFCADDNVQYQQHVSSHGTTDTRIRRQVPSPLKKKQARHCNFSEESVNLPSHLKKINILIVLDYNMS